MAVKTQTPRRVFGRRQPVLQGERRTLEIESQPETAYYASLQGHYSHVRWLAWIVGRLDRRCGRVRGTEHDVRRGCRPHSRAGHAANARVLAAGDRREPDARGDDPGGGRLADGDGHRVACSSMAWPCGSRWAPLPCESTASRCSSAAAPGCCWAAGRVAGGRARLRVPIVDGLKPCSQLGTFNF